MQAVELQAAVLQALLRLGSHQRVAFSHGGFPNVRATLKGFIGKSRV